MDDYRDAMYRAMGEEMIALGTMHKTAFIGRLGGALVNAAGRGVKSLGKTRFGKDLGVSSKGFGKFRNNLTKTMGGADNLNKAVGAGAVGLGGLGVAKATGIV